MVIAKLLVSAGSPDHDTAGQWFGALITIANLIDRDERTC